MTDTEMLTAIADRLTIIDLIHNSCRGIDRMDKELAYSVWHEDAIADFSALGGYLGDGRGYVDQATEMHGHMEAHMHLAGNILIELEGNRAASETCIFVSLQQRDGERLVRYSSWCRYLDQWSKREGRWGIDKRTGISDFDEVREVTGTGLEATGLRSRADLSYANFATLASSRLG